MEGGKFAFLARALQLVALALLGAGIVWLWMQPPERSLFHETVDVLLHVIYGAPEHREPLTPEEHAAAVERYELLHARMCALLPSLHGALYALVALVFLPPLYYLVAQPLYARLFLLAGSLRAPRALIASTLVHQTQ
jgi:hypothetical protein